MVTSMALTLEQHGQTAFGLLLVQHNKVPCVAETCRQEAGEIINNAWGGRYLHPLWHLADLTDGLFSCSPCHRGWGTSLQVANCMKPAGQDCT